MKRYPKIRYPSNPETDGIFEDGTIVIEEKMDGANFRFTIKDGELKFGSRNCEGEDLQRDQFSQVIEFLKDREELFKYNFGMEDSSFVFFMEAMMPHTLEYNWKEVPPVIGFDIWDKEEHKFVTREEVEEFFGKIDIPVVPLVDVVDAEDWEDYDFEVPESEYANRTAEGVVLKNHEQGIYAKYKTPEFKEKNKMKFGGDTPKSGMDDTEELMFDYVTAHRVEKMAHKLIDEDKYTHIQMEMMEKLPKMMLKDIAEEDAREILMEEHKTIDLGRFRSLISSRCAAVLKRLHQEKIREKMGGN